MKKLSGFTLIELTVVLAIAAIMAKYAISSFGVTTDRYRLTGERDRLVTDMQYARAESMREGSPVTVCASIDGLTCAPSGTAWNKGWIVFSDLNGNGVVDSSTTPTDIMLKQQKAFTNSSDTFTTTSNIAAFTFNRLGLLQNGNPNAAATEIIASTTPASVGSTQCVYISFLGLMTVPQRQVVGGVVSSGC